MKQISFLAVTFAMSGIIFSVLPSAYSQTSDVDIGDEITLSGDLLNNPFAMEILQKIEESKRKIAKLEQQSYDNLQAQKFLEDRRSVALDRLNQVLALWEEEWYEFSPKVAYQKFLDKMPSGVQGIYAKQFAFTEKKHEYGLTAKTKALDSGMVSYKALEKFNSAAKSTVGELAEYNEKIQPNYEYDQKRKLSERIAHWDDYINSKDEQIKRDQSAIESGYSIKLSKVTKDERFEIRGMIQNHDDEIITRTELSEELGAIRDKYNPVKEDIINKKDKALSKLDQKYDNWIPKVSSKLMSSSRQIDANIGIVWDSNAESYKVISMTAAYSPHKPIISGLVAEPTQIHLFWDSPPSIDDELVTGYKIEMKRDNQRYHTLVEDTGNKNTTYLHKDLFRGEFYTYRISAITDVAVSDPSNEIRASTAIS